MAIEIKELVIKTTIVDRPATAERAPELTRAARSQILAECRQMVAELLRERGER
jgi:hypothetical protein